MPPPAYILLYIYTIFASVCFVYFCVFCVYVVYIFVWLFSAHQLCVCADASHRDYPPPHITYFCLFTPVMHSIAIVLLVYFFCVCTCVCFACMCNLPVKRISYLIPCTARVILNPFLKRTAVRSFYIAACNQLSLPGFGLRHTYIHITFRVKHYFCWHHGLQILCVVRYGAFVVPWQGFLRPWQHWIVTTAMLLPCPQLLAWVPIFLVAIALPFLAMLRGCEQGLYINVIKRTVHSYGRAGRCAKVAPPSGQRDKALSSRTETRGEFSSFVCIFCVYVWLTCISTLFSCASWVAVALWMGLPHHS